MKKMEQKVRAWKEVVTIPTYGIGEAEKNPVFLENRVYQGSSGVVYPHPVIEKILDKKEDKEWNAIFLENKYLKIMILPELGGRVQMAYDKIKQRHFVYYNQVIKPALVGLTGPWISGGIEFNWPQHHRPSTYDPVDSLIEENEDGSVTVWCSEIERMFRTKGMAGFTLYPDAAYMEIKAKLYNRTPHPQTFLWWANPAVKVNDSYQSVFPPNVNAVFDHGKRDVSSFPIATGTYYKVDYSAGVDISKYKNIPVPTSFMAIQSKYDFVGGYENDTKSGLLHVADHHVSPGKKQWTWGNGDFGKAWDRNLTDEDGSYIELMCGVYTDNQPDFTWLQPYEEKSFKQYFMPYRDLGMVKNATKEAMLNLEFEEDNIRIRVYTTSEYLQATICLKSDDKTLFMTVIDLSPEMSFDQSIMSTANQDNCYISVRDQKGELLVDWQTESEQESPIPEPAKAAKTPEDIETCEQLYLRGLHLEQYRHATFKPTDYYIEALKREPGDIRNNNAMGLWLLRRGQFAKAEPFFKQAIETLTERNPNPYDGESFFNLGICLRLQGKSEEAYAAFFKSSWNAAWQDSSFFNIAQIDACSNNYKKALDLVDRSLWKNWNNQKARHLKVTLLRKLGKKKEALHLIEESLKLDGFNFGILYEKYLLLRNIDLLLSLKEQMRNNVHSYIEFSLDYAMSGFYTDAIDFISLYLDITKNAYPMAGYLKAYYLKKDEKPEEALMAFKTASSLSPDYCFPNRNEELLALQMAVKENPDDSKAWYYLGNFWYGARQYEEALLCWENSRDIDDSFPTVHRNLALTYYNKKDKPDKARASLEKAYELNPADARVLMELDQLYKKLGVSQFDRLSLLERHPEQVDFRDDLYLEKITLYNLKGEEQIALQMILHRKFHPWEGGEGKVSEQYVFSLTEAARKALREKNYTQAASLLKEALVYPENLGEGKLAVSLDNEIHFNLGCAYEGLNKMDEANRYWEISSLGSGEPSMAIYYNDNPPELVYYQGLALQKLGFSIEAEKRFRKLIDFGHKHLNDRIRIDYFAVSLPSLLIWEDDLDQRNRMHCLYMIGLGQMGLGNMYEAAEKLKEVFSQDKYHLGVVKHLNIIENR